MASALKTTICLVFLIISVMTVRSSARILNELVMAPQDLPVDAPTNEDDSTIPPVLETAPPVVGNPEPPVPASPEVPAAPVIAPAGAAGAGTSATKLPQLSFFMHDVIGGSHPSERVVTGVITNSEISGVPFSKPNNNVFPVSGGVPLVNGNNINGINNVNGLINNNNLPFLTGINGAQVNTVIQNTGTNNVVSGGNNQPFVTAGELPSGTTLQNLMFGSITVFNDELTEGHELGSAVIGNAQGFYVASSLDGTSQTIAVTTMFHGGDHGKDNSISFFGVHRTASPESQVAIVGGTGKYEHAKGYASVVTLPTENQHTTDGVDTIVEFTVYFSE